MAPDKSLAVELGLALVSRLWGLSLSARQESRRRHRAAH